MIRAILIRMFRRASAVPVDPVPTWLDIRMAQRRAARPVKAEAARRAAATAVHNRYARDVLIQGARS